MRKLWFTCETCQTHYWLPALGTFVDYFQGIAEDMIFCPWCETEQPAYVMGARKPAKLLFTEDIRRTHGY